MSSEPHFVSEVSVGANTRVPRGVAGRKNVSVSFPLFRFRDETGPVRRARLVGESLRRAVRAAWLFDADARRAGALRMAVETDRHLLFGLLALQINLVDQDQLVAGFRAWSRDKTRPLAEHLKALGHLDDEQCAGVEAMVGLHLKKHGDAEKSLAALPTGPSTRARLAAVSDPELSGAVDRLASGSTPTEAGPDATVTYSVGSATPDGQRFRVLRPHARGGLGAVFVALDTELHREVALKEMLESHADDPTSRRRFVLEAEVTGGLEHPGIVPVYGLGSYSNGRPYYAMRFIGGESLKDAIAAYHGAENRKANPGRRSLELRNLLRRFVDVCNAIDYAHAHGVLHRDIKPSNVIVGKRGETLVVDWGLAKAQARPEGGEASGERPLVPSSVSGSSETLPGTALGTPAYMSPEQARGELDGLGPATDVYGLGTTLYCLLTGHPPFENDDVGAVLQSVQKGAFRPPRSVDPTLDPALEAICLKAMAREPDGRYPNPRAVADDIERWMADEPVTVYREPFRRRLARWERRHKALVHSGIAVVAITAVGLAIMSSIATQQKRATEEAMKQAETSARVAEARLQIAINAVYQLNNEVQNGVLNSAPGMESARRRLADAAVREFKRFLTMRPDDEALVWHASRAFSNAAVVHSLLGDFATARKLYNDNIQELERLLSPRYAGELETRRILAAAYRDMAVFLQQENGHDEESEPYFETAHSSTTILLDRVDDFPPPAQAQIKESAGWLAVKVGDAQLDRGESEQAGNSYRRAIAMLAPVAANPKAWYWYRLFTAQAHQGLGAIHRERKQPAAEQEFADAERIIRNVMHEAPSQDAEPREELAIALVTHWGEAPADTARAGDADAALDEAVALLDRNTKDFPANTWYRRDRTRALLARARRHAAAGRIDRAEHDLTEAQRLLAELVAKEAENWSYPGDRGRVEVALAQLRLKQSRAEEARKSLSEGIAHLEQACKYRPRNVHDRRSLDDARKLATDLTSAAAAKAGGKP